MNYKSNNLCLLCPNCHSLTPTYKGGNKKIPKNDSRSIKHRLIYAASKERMALTIELPAH